MSGEEWTFSRVLTLMDEEGRTGILEIGVPSTGTTTHVHVRKGYVVNVQEVVGDSRWLLGDYLVFSGMADQLSVLSAEKEAQKKGIAVEEVLASSETVSQDLLKRFVDLQTTGLLLPLFQEEGLTIRFLDERPKANTFATDLPVSYLLKEAERQGEQWPTLRQRVGRPSAVYQPDVTAMAELLGYDEHDEDSEDPPVPEVGMNTRVVYYYSNGAKTVEQVARASGLSLYDTYQAYAELLEHYLVDLVTPHSKGEERGVVGEHLSRLVSLVTYGVIAALLALSGQWIFAHAGEFTPSATASTVAIEEVIQTATFEVVEEALQLHALRYGAFPEDPSELIAKGLLRPRAAATIDQLSYATDGEHYTLAWAP